MQFFPVCYFPVFSSHSMYVQEVCTKKGGFTLVNISKSVWHFHILFKLIPEMRLSRFVFSKWPPSAGHCHVVFPFFFPFSVRSFLLCYSSKRFVKELSLYEFKFAKYVLIFSFTMVHMMSKPADWPSFAGWINNIKKAERP